MLGCFDFYKDTDILFVIQPAHETTYISSFFEGVRKVWDREREGGQILHFQSGINLVILDQMSRSLQE